MKHSISLIINGDPVDAIVKDNLTLLDFLRDQMFLTGTKKGMRGRGVRRVYRYAGRKAGQLLLYSGCGM